MKRYLLLSLIALLSIGVSFAQHKKVPTPAMMQELLDFKIKFLSKEMELNKEQQQKFADLYTKMDQERRKLFDDTRKLEQSIKKNKKATEADYEAVTNAISDAKRKDSEIEKKYDDLFSTFLSKKQLFKLKTAEDKFHKKMREMRNHKNGKNKPHKKACKENCPEDHECA